MRVSMRTFLLAACSVTAAANLIQSCFDKDCQHWQDTNGWRIQAHGGGLLQSPVDGRWYWYGESKKTDASTNASLMKHGVTCYSAPSLAGPWTREGRVMYQALISVPGIPGPWIIERPKVVYNAKTKKFVMWFHLDILHATRPFYAFRHAGVATASHPAGPFTFVHAVLPDGIPSLDMSLWVDVDQKAYFIRSCANEYVGISGLTEDYLNTTGLLSTAPKFEGMALFRHTNGTLYVIASHMTGWDPNPLMLFRSDGPNLADPRWVNLGNPTGDKVSFNTQPTYVVPFTTDNGFVYNIYMADNWLHGGRRGLVDASYVWLPIRFEGDGVYIDRAETWDLQDPFGHAKAEVIV